MIKRLHEHILTELNHSSRTDTIFIVVAVVFNLISLGINMGVSEEDIIILTIFIVMTILVNAIALGGLYVGRQTRGKLLRGLVAIYEDNQVAKYYDQSLIKNYGVRYTLFGGVIAVIAIVAIVVPLVFRSL